MSRIRIDTIVNKPATGAPDFPYGLTAQTASIVGVLTAGTYEINELNITGVSTLTGAINADSTVASSSTITGAVIVAGGVGVGKSVYIGGNVGVGGNFSAGGTITYDDVTNVDSIGIVTARTGIEVTAGGITVAGGGLDIVGLTTGLSVTGPSTYAGNVLLSSGTVQINDTTESTDKDTGAVVINGGVGIEKNLNVGIGLTVEASGFATFSQGMKIGGGMMLKEKIHIEGTAWNSSGDINLDYGNTHYNTANLGGTNNTINITSARGINTSMDVGDVLSVTCITAVSASTAYINQINVDHRYAGITSCWVGSVGGAGGNVPTEGGSNGVDIYAMNIIKTGNLAFTVIANHNKAPAG